MLDIVSVPSPKIGPSKHPFRSLYSYYAGFPETFVEGILKSSPIAPGSLIFDPWNGSGTTTTVASRLGFRAIGYDLNPVMIVVAKARLLPKSEAQSLNKLAAAIIQEAAGIEVLSTEDPLLSWFKPKTANCLRRLERAAAGLLLPPADKHNVNEISYLTAAIYTAIFSATLTLATPFKTANPTWTRVPKEKASRLQISETKVHAAFRDAVRRMINVSIVTDPLGQASVQHKDSTNQHPAEDVDFILTSPPYCTRIDYASSTRVELAVLAEIHPTDAALLRKNMLGTTAVSRRPISSDPRWGRICTEFLEAVQQHPSKASSGYYLRTHLDYFDKMYRSIATLSKALRSGGTAVLVAQNSYYKELHNDLAAIIGQMADREGLSLVKQTDFQSKNCMSRVNARAVAGTSRGGSIESVLFFEKRSLT